MRILFHELRKIWRPVPLLALLLVTLFFYQALLSYYLRALPDESEVRLDIFTDWRRQYGVTLDADEIPGVEAQLNDLIAEANEIIAHWDETKHPNWASFSDIGITNFDEYLALLGDFERTEEETAVAALLLDSRSNFLYTRYHTVYKTLLDYEFQKGKGIEEYLYDGQEPDKLARCAEIDATEGMVRSILPCILLDATSEFLSALCLLILLAASVLLSPYLVRDRLSRMPQQQWTARTGRRIFRYQLGAALLSALLLTLLYLVVFGIWFCIRWRMSVFRDCFAYALDASPTPWFTMTFGAYWLVCAGIVLLLALAGGVLMFFLSQYSAHYVAMLLKALPLYLALAFFSQKALQHALFFGNPLSNAAHLVGIEILAPAGLLLAALLLCFAAAKRQEKKELR